MNVKEHQRIIECHRSFIAMKSNSDYHFQRKQELKQENETLKEQLKENDEEIHKLRQEMKQYVNEREHAIREAE